MFRKFFTVVMAMFLVIGGLFAEELKGVFRKFEDGKVSVEVDGKVKEYKVSPDAKFKQKKGEILLTDALKLAKEGAKGTFTVENDVVTKVTIDRDMKKKKKKTQ